MRRRKLGRALIALLFSGFSFSTTPVHAQSHDVTFHIRAQPIAQALIDFAVQAGLSIGHAGIDFHGEAANAVDGRLSPPAALTTLLAGTGYGYVFRDSQTIQILPLVAAPPTPNPAQLIEEIVVTATKRPEVAQALPYSIVVLTGADLSDARATVTNDLAGHVAALTATNLGAGQDKLFIRGLSDSVLTGRSQSVVGLYLDEARVTDDAPDPGLRLVDIDKVEIVRGPQGTLYGAGTLGGLIRIITNKPLADRVEAMAATSVAATEGGAPSFGADAMLNVPIIADRLALRSVFYEESDGGFIDDIRMDRKNVNHTVTQGGRFALRWLPDDDWSVTVGLTGQMIDADDSQYSQVGLPALKRANFEPEPHDDHFLQANLTLEGTFDWAKLTSASAMTKRRIVNQYDASLEWSALTGLPFSPSIFHDVRDIQSVTHESRLTSTGDKPLSWVSGLFLSHRDEDYQSRLQGIEASNAGAVARAEQRDDHADEAALFDEVTYWGTDWLSLTVGARLFYAALNASSQIGHPLSSTAIALAGGANREIGVTKRAVLSIRPQDNLTFYASASQGIRLGGININSPAGATNVNATPSDNGEKPNASAFPSDTLWTYELGAKTSLLDGRLIANTAAYVTFWDNVQSDQILSDGSLFIANVGNVRDPGFELDATFQVTPHLRLQGNFFWNDPKIVHQNPLLIQTSGLLPGVPENSFGLSGRYDVPLGHDTDAAINLDYAYVGKSYLGFDEMNSPPMGNYFTGNFRLGILRDHWEATLYLNNFMNEHANSFAYGNPFSFAKTGQITPLRPRTIGLGISWTY